MALKEYHWGLVLDRHCSYELSDFTCQDVAHPTDWSLAELKALWAAAGFANDKIGAAAERPL